MVASHTEPGAASYGAALYLAVIQFFFFTTWTVYVVFLPSLVTSVGLPPEVGVWLVLLDQVIFAVMDTLMGFAADTIERLLGRIGPLVVGLTCVSSLAFLALPWLAELTGVSSAVRAPIFVALIVVWAICSSVLRAPPMVLLAKHASKPRVPWMAALYLTGLALGGAVSPYLGSVLRGMDPRIPFAATSLTLLLTTFGLLWIERLQRNRIAQDPDVSEPRPWRALHMLVLLVGTILIGFGFQGHFFLNSKAQFLAFAKPVDLGVLMPVFWIGFNLCLYPGAALAKRLNPTFVMALGAGLGGLGALAAAFAPNLGLLVVAQLLAGAGWGAAFMAGISAALALGRGGREGLMLGLWFSTLAVAAIVRVSFVLTGAHTTEPFAQAAEILSGMLWATGAIPLLFLAIYALKTAKR